METSNPRKRRRLDLPETDTHADARDVDDDTTDVKLAILSSQFPDLAQDTLLDRLVGADGSVEAACRSLELDDPLSLSPKKSSSGGYQSSISSFAAPRAATDAPGSRRPSINRPLTRKGRTLHLYSPEDVAAYTPCSIIHNFLPAQDADDLLKELLKETPTFERYTFKLFDNIVQSPHSAGFYVHSLDEQERQKKEYLYNGSYLSVCRNGLYSGRPLCQP